MALESKTSSTIMSQKIMTVSTQQKHDLGDIGNVLSAVVQTLLTTTALVMATCLD
jgi:hypothetical protein